jgi:hypothetical protein
MPPEIMVLKMGDVCDIGGSGHERWHSAATRFRTSQEIRANAGVRAAKHGATEHTHEVAWEDDAATGEVRALLLKVPRVAHEDLRCVGPGGVTANGPQPVRSLPARYKARQVFRR